MGPVPVPVKCCQALQVQVCKTEPVWGMTRINLQVQMVASKWLDKNREQPSMLCNSDSDLASLPLSQRFLSRHCVLSRDFTIICVVFLINKYFWYFHRISVKPWGMSCRANSPTLVSPFTVHFWVSQFGWQLWFMKRAWFPLGPASIIRSWNNKIQFCLHTEFNLHYQSSAMVY